MTVTKDNSKPAVTHLEVLKRYKEHTLVKLVLETGRTHQIRVHMSSMGFPIIGDYTYAFQKNKLKDIMAPERVMLHARRLKLEHPTLRGKTLDLSAQPPKDFKMLAEELERVYG